MNRFFACLICLGFFNYAHAVDVDSDDKLTKEDIEALRDWVNTKRQVTVKERGGNLSISGEVRTEFQAKSEKKEGFKQLGHGGKFPDKPSRRWDVEVNLMMDYRSDRTWSAIKLEFDNRAGTVSGTVNKVSLEKAYLGGRALACDTYTLDFEIGRRYFGTVYDSNIEFGSLMDGIVIKYDHALDTLGDLYIHGGPFLIDDRVDQYGWVAELGILNIYDTGLYCKYSIIDWQKNLKHRRVKGKKLNEGDEKDLIDFTPRQRFDFLISQLILGYKFVPKCLDKVVTLYSGGLVNHIAKSVEVTKDKKERFGWYAGFSAGELRKQYDWSFNFNYQWVQGQAVPPVDSGGIGLGNAAGAGFYSVKRNGSGGQQTVGESVGSTNFRGFAIEFLYLLSNNLTLYQSWQQSQTLNRTYSPSMRYKAYEIELIYGF